MIPKTNIIFESKRNYCYYDKDKHCVVKRFETKDSYVTEKDMLQELEHDTQLRSPNLLSHNEKTLTLNIEYIDGSLVLEKLEQYEREDKLEDAMELLDGLIKWLKQFYNINPGRIYGDVNLRNFIVTSTGIVGLDFEQCGYGDPAKELEFLLAIYQLYDPKETFFKQKVSDQMIFDYHINNRNVKEQMTIINKRRHERSM